MAMPKTIKSLGRFSNNILKHPGTWILGSLIAVGMGFAMPAIAPALVIVALVGSIAAAATLLWQAKKFGARAKKFGARFKQFWSDSKENKLPADFVPTFDVIKADPFQFLAMACANFIKNRPLQFIVIGLSFALPVVALVLTIGFFTGGVGFAFMTPVFAAISAPFAAAATAGGISLYLPALAGFCFTIAAINLPNTVKRFMGWLDSFKYDAVVDMKLGEDIDWLDKNAVREKVNTILKNQGLCIYEKMVFSGILSTIANGGSSPYKEKRAAAWEQKAKEVESGSDREQAEKLRIKTNR